MLSRIRSKKHFQDVLKNHKITVVEFTTPTCGACNTMKTILKNIISKGSTNGTGFYECSVEINPDLINQYHVRQAPVIVIFKDTVLEDLIPGLMSEKKLLERILACH